MYQLNVFLHIGFACIWLGGNVLLFLIGPAIRKSSPELRSFVNRKFKVLSWFAYAGLLVTGVFNLAFRGVLDDFFAFVRANTFFALKISLVLFLGISKAIHDFFLGPRGKEKGGIWFKATWALALLNTVLLASVIYLSVRVVRG